MGIVETEAFREIIDPRLMYVSCYSNILFKHCRSFLIRTFSQFCLKHLLMFLCPYNIRYFLSYCSLTRTLVSVFFSHGFYVVVIMLS